MTILLFFIFFAGLVVFASQTLAVKKVSLDDVHDFLRTFRMKNKDANCLIDCFVQKEVIPSVSNKTTNDTDTSPDDATFRVIKTTPTYVNVHATNYYNYAGDNYNFYFGTAPVSTGKPSPQQHPLLMEAIHFCTRMCDVFEERAFELLFNYFIAVLPLLLN
jgi:hypothetical protein